VLQPDGALDVRDYHLFVNDERVLFRYGIAS
jgi:hypothetical protein